MDILPQTILNFIVLFYGFLLLAPICNGTNIFMLTGLAWFVGWGVLGVTSILIVISGISVSLTKLLFISLIFLIVLWLVSGRKNSLAITMNQYITILWSIIFSSICFYIISILLNYMHYSPDAIQNEGLSRIFHLYGVYADGQSRVFYWLFNTRLPFFVSVNNVAYLGGIKIYYTFLTITTIMAIVTFGGVWAHLKKTTSFIGKLIFFVATGFYLTNKLILFHSFYTLSNLTTMAYFSVGSLSLWLYLSKGRNIWLLFGCLFLGITCIIRKEMLVLSMVPFVYIFFQIKCKQVLRYLCFSIYGLCAYGWYLWGCFFLLGIDNVFSDLSNGSHGGLEVVFICILCSTGLFLIPWVKIDTKKKTIMLLIVFILFVASCYFIPSMQLSGYKMYLYLFKDAGQWGNVWYAVLIVMSLFIVMGLLSKFYPSLKPSEGSFYLFSVVVGYMVVRLILYGVYGQPKDDTWNNSGNRIILHVFPVSIFFVASVLYDLKSQSLYLKEQIARGKIIWPTY